MDPKHERLLKSAAEHVAVSCWEPDTLIEKAKGSKIWLNGKPLLDFACGPGVANIGWNHPEVKKIIKSVLDKDESGYGGNMILNQYERALAEKLCRITPGKFSKKVFFSNSGLEAVDSAILACRKRRPERRAILSFIGDFHGRLGFARTATTSRQMHIEGLLGGMEKAFFLVFPAENPETELKKVFLNYINTPDKYLTYVKNTISPFIQDINCALLELVEGEGGINVAKKEYVQVLIDYLKMNGVIVIIDEIQSGLGRTGKMWASDLYEIEPDIMTVAKALSGGLIPIGATIMREELSYQKYGEHCNTFGGGALACAVGLKVLEIIQKEKLAEQAKVKGEGLRRNLYERCANPVSGCGLMNRMTFPTQKIQKAAITEAKKMGLYLTSAGEKSVRLMPPLTVSKQEIEQAQDILIEASIKTQEMY